LEGRLCQSLWFIVERLTCFGIDQYDL
jgi:hypothetical protein